MPGEAAEGSLSLTCGPGLPSSVRLGPRKHSCTLESRALPAGPASGHVGQSLGADLCPWVGSSLLRGGPVMCAHRCVLVRLGFSSSFLPVLPGHGRATSTCSWATAETIFSVPESSLFLFPALLLVDLLFFGFLSVCACTRVSMHAQQVACMAAGPGTCVGACAHACLGVATC